MGLQEEVDILRKIPLFTKIDASKLKLLAFTSEHLEFADGDLICKQGDEGDAAFILLEGEADVIVSTDQGELKVASLARNDVVGEIAILCDVPRTATVAATSAVKTLRISKEGFFNLVKEFPQVGVQIMQELASRLNETTQKVTKLTAELRAAGGSG